MLKNSTLSSHEVIEDSTIVLPVGMKVNCSEDIGTSSEEFGEISWWMSENVQRNYRRLRKEERLDDDEATAVEQAAAEAFAKVAELLAIAANGGDFDTYMIAARSVIAHASSTRELMFNAHDSGAEMAYSAILKDQAKDRAKKKRPKKKK